MDATIITWIFLMFCCLMIKDMGNKNFDEGRQVKATLFNIITIMLVIVILFQYLSFMN